MKNSKKIFALLICIALLGTILVGCSDSNPSNSSDTNTNDTNTNDTNSNSSNTTTPVASELGSSSGGKTDTQVDKVVIALGSASVDVSPFAPSSPGTTMKCMLYAKLFYQPYYGAPIEDCIPWIAKSYTQVDNVTYEVELFDNVTDSKGNAITVDDIIYSVNKSVEIGQFVDGGSNIASMEKIDDYNMRFVLTTDAPNTFSMLMTNSQFCIVDEDWYENASEDEKTNNPATTSAYTVTEFISGAGCTLTANDDYWQTDEELNSKVLPACRNVKDIVYTVITEASMRVIALQNGEVDIAAVNATDLNNFMDLSTGTDLEGWTSCIPALTYIHGIFPNMSTDSVLGNSVELRKAVFYALDAEQIMLASGQNELTAAPVTAYAVKDYQGYQPEWDNRDYFECDVEKAKELITEAGYQPGEVTLRLLSSSALYNDSVRSVIISELQEAGFNVESVAVDQALFSTYKNDSSIWDLMIDLKSATTGHIASLYNYNFAAANYTDGQGGVNFCKDQTLYDLLDTLMSDASDENIKAVEQYLEDQAIIYGLYSNAVANVAQGGILEVGISGTLLVPPACIFADDYKSVVD